MMPPELLSILQSGGIGLVPVLGYMWYRAEARADRERDKNHELAQATIATSVKLETTVGTLVTLLMSGNRAG